MVFMIAGGIVTAGVLLMLFAFSRSREVELLASDAVDRDLIAGSILFQLARLGGASPAEAVENVRTRASLPIGSRSEIDISNWGSVYRQASNTAQRERLLEHAVLVATASSRSLPLAQYNALLDLAFALGFHTDALARLRLRHPFSYEDHAKRGRPRSADRGPTSTPLFARPPVDPSALLRVLGLPGGVSRRTLISTYRKLAAQNHPDRFFAASSDEQNRASARFIEITEAYQRLLPFYENLEESTKV